MKYTYRSKTYKLKNKLKILLTILLAALITTTGYLLSRDVLSKLDYEYFNETTIDGINIKVVGERGVIPNNSTLKIEKVSKNEKDIVDDSINEIKDNNMNIVESYTYDIKILDEEENEIEPSDEIKIIFTNNLINNKNLDTNIYHTSTDEENNLSTEVLKGEVEKDTITTKTNSFSYYTVEFTYNNLQYSMQGDSEVKLSSILEQVGLAGEVTSVEGSNDSLFSFEKRDNEWYVKALQAFQTREWMKVTIDDIVYEITVTDATNYTITYQSGSDGHFADGTTTNVVSYSLTTDQVTKYSHTPNVDDTGLQNGNYANNLNTNEVVTIPGATTLTVDIYYNGESVTYDWLSVWAGNYPSYTASSNKTSTGYVTTDMGAPNNNNKFGGSQSGSYTVNGNALSNMGHCTLTIPGDSVTFGFKSDSSGVGKGYGYYAIVSGIGEVRTITSGTYKEPIPNNSEYRFKEWSQDPNTISTNTTISAVYVEDLLTSTSKGTYDGVDWKIKGDGTLIIGKTGTTQSYTNSTSRSQSDWPWYQYRSQITGIEFAGTVNGNGSHSGMFYECSNATYINISNFNTSNVTNMNSMFSNCTSFINLDVSNFNTTNVTEMAGMFWSCTDLTSLDLSNFNTSNVTNMDSMFEYCSSLTSLDLSNFNTSNVTSMSVMFSGCSSLPYLDLSGFETYNLQGGLDSLFYECSSLISIDLSNFYINNIYSISCMFEYCSSLTTIDLGNWDVSNIGNMSNMFAYCESLTSIDLSDWNTSSLYQMDGMFYGCSSLTTLDLSNFDTSGINGLNSVFTNCSNLETLILTNFTMDQAGDFYGTFANCSSLKVLDLSSFDMSNAWEMTDMFLNTTDLDTLMLGFDWKFLPNNGLTGLWQRDGDTTIYTAAELTANYNGSTMAGTYRWPKEAYAEFDSSTGILRFFRDDEGLYTDLQVVGNKTYYTDFENLDINQAPAWLGKSQQIRKIIFDDEIKPINTYCWFHYMEQLTEIINIEYLNTSNCTKMEMMFSNCKSLTNLDLSSFDTSKVTTMESMFASCNNLTTLDLSNFDTSEVTSLYYMFGGCEKLKVIDLSHFDTSKVETMMPMFYNVKAEYINISNFDFSHVSSENIAGFFVVGSANEIVADNVKFSVDNSSFLASSFIQNISIKNPIFMPNSNIAGFFGGTQLETLDLSTWDTSDVTSMNSMFSGMGRLHILKLGANIDFINDTNLSKKWVRDGDTTIYTGAELTNSYDGSTMAGTYRALQQLTITEQVKGSLADINKNFDFTINVKNNGAGINATYEYTGSKNGDLVFNNGNAAFSLKHGESISTYLPYYYDYIITQNSDGYTLSKTNDTGTFESDNIASFTDTLDGTTPTGIFLDLVPFIILITFGVFGIFLIRKFKYI